MMAYITRLSQLKKCIDSAPEDCIIISERCLYTDRYVFAKMLYDNNLIEEIDLSHNNLSEVPYLPNTLLSFDCSFNHKIEIIYLSENIIELNCNHCNVKEIEINDVIEVLLCDYNPISNLGYLPNCLEKISCKYTKIKKLENIPNNLEYLNIEGCEFCDEDIKYFDIFVDLCSFNC
jgi:Leucine-rich repeat (LRR) protein